MCTCFLEPVYGFFVFLELCTGTVLTARTPLEELRKRALRSASLFSEEFILMFVFIFIKYVT